MSKLSHKTVLVVFFLFFFGYIKTEIIVVGDNEDYVYGMGYAPQSEPFKTNLTLA